MTPSHCRRTLSVDKIERRKSSNDEAVNLNLELPVDSDVGALTADR